MELAPAWMSYSKENSSSQGTRFLGKERERGVPKYGRQLSFSHMPTYHSSPDYDRTSSVPFACSLSSPPPPNAPASILGEPQPRVLNRSKSSPGFGSPKSKQKKSPDRAFSSFSKPPKPKPPKPPLSPSSYMKSHSQPNLFNNEKINNWHQAHKAQQSPLPPSSLSSSVPSSSFSSPSSNSPSSSSPSVSSVSSVPPSTSPPLPPSSSPPPILVPEIDKLKTLIPATGPPPKSVRARVMVGPPLPLAKKAPPSLPNNNNNNNNNNINSVSSSSAIVNINTLNNSNNSNNSNNGNNSGSNSPNGPSSLAAYFRKATSEPSLMHHQVPDVVRRAAAKKEFEKEKEKEREKEKEKAKEKEKEKATFLKEQAASLKEQLLKEAVGAKQAKRSNFFQHVIRQEEQGISITEDESPIGVDNTTVEPSSVALSLSSSSALTSSASTSSSSLTSPPSPSLSFSPPFSPPLSPPPPSGIRSPLPEDMEDEERFLRTLGWVPDEEDPVPVLDEEEMRDVRVKIFLSRGAKTSEGEEGPRNVEIGVDVK